MTNPRDISLTAALARQVPSRVQARGRSYFVSGAVRSVQGDELAMEATVRGSIQYQVGVTREGDTLAVTCTCPYFDDRAEVCKHIWAALLVAE